MSPAAAAGLYLHIPFCSAVCPYCDFAVLPTAAASSRRYVRALIGELAMLAEEELAFDTIYFGGGTPSALAAAELEAVADEVLQELADLHRIGVDVR